MSQAPSIETQKRVNMFIAAVLSDGRLLWAVVRGGRIREHAPALAELWRSEPRAWSFLGSARQSVAAPARPCELRSAILEMAHRSRTARRARRDGVLVGRGDQVFRLSPHRVQGGARQTDAVLVILTDVSDLSREREELRSSLEKLMRHDRAGVIGQVGLGLVHDLGNILGALRLRLDVLARNERFQQRAGQGLNVLFAISDEARLLLTRLQRLAAGEEGVPADVDLRSVILSAIDRVSKSMGLDGRDAQPPFSFVCALPPGTPAVFGMEDEVRRLFVVLLVILVDGMPKGGTMTLGAGSRPGAVVVTVDEAGTGRRPDRQNGLETGAPDDHRAVDVGLSTVSSLLAGMGGRLHAGRRARGRIVIELQFSTGRRAPQRSQRVATADGRQRRVLPARA